VRLGNGLWAGNLHTESRADQGRLAAAALRQWAGGSPAVLGGDFNVRDLELDGFTRAGSSGVDQVFVTGGLSAAAEAEVLERGRLSDHAPVLVTVMRNARYAC
jgi:endonuclease/exonuclease/phosphatase (EEP) superfamily protein YafD